MADRITIVSGSEDAFPQILRIGFATPPKHSSLRGKPETYESYLGGVSEPPFSHGCDSSLAENALVKHTVRRESEPHFLEAFGRT
jgi:hypothetical protein